MANKQTELANILRHLADYIDRHPDQELAGILEQAANLISTSGRQKKRLRSRSSEKFQFHDIHELASKLRMLRSRGDGEQLLQDKAPTRQGLEALSRFLQLPVQKDDTIERLRAKIVENTIGTRLRSEAIQG